MKAFKLYDEDRTGKISFKVSNLIFKNIFKLFVFKNLKSIAKQLGESLTDEELQEMIDEADMDGDGEGTCFIIEKMYENFLKFCI